MKMALVSVKENQNQGGERKREMQTLINGLWETEGLMGPSEDMTTNLELVLHSQEATHAIKNENETPTERFA